MSILPLQTKNDLTDLARYCKQRWPSQLVGKDRIFLLSPIQLSIEWFCKQIHIQSYIYIHWSCQKNKQQCWFMTILRCFPPTFPSQHPRHHTPFSAPANTLMPRMLRTTRSSRKSRNDDASMCNGAGWGHAIPMPFPSPWHGEIGGFTWFCHQTFGYQQPICSTTRKHNPQIPHGGAGGAIW